MANPNKPERPQIYAYDDFKAYLRDMYNYLKRTRKNFSYRSFTKKAGLSASNYLLLVINGKRKVGAESISKVANGLELSPHESEFLESLVLFNQAGSTQEKKKYFNRIRTNKRYKQFRELDVHQYEFFSKWYYAAVWSLIDHQDFKNDPEWISNKLIGRITPKQASDAIELLLKLNMVREKRGKLELTEQLISSAPQVHSLALMNFQHEMLSKALESLDSISGDLRDITSVTISLDENDLTSFKKKVLKFRRQLLSFYQKKDKRFDRVYQMCFALFPLSGKIRK